MFLLLACTPSPQETAVEVVQSQGRVDAEWSADDLKTIFADPSNFPDLGPQDLRDTFFGLMAKGDTECPGNPTQLLGIDLRGCTSASGYFYAGVSTWMPDEAHSWMLAGDFEIIDPEGHRFIGGGDVNAGAMGNNVGGTIHGEWSYPGGSSGWMDSGISAYLSETSGQVEDFSWIQLDGGLTYRGKSYWFDRLALQVDCPTGQGSLRIRDPSGGWYTLDYGEGCPPCPDLSFEGNPIVSEVCPDFGPWLQQLQIHLAQP